MFYCFGAGAKYSMTEKFMNNRHPFIELKSFYLPWAPTNVVVEQILILET